MSEGDRKVVSFEEYRQARAESEAGWLAIEGNGRADVVPVELMEKLADGELAFAEIEDGEGLARAMANEILITLGHRQSAMEEE